MLSVLTTQEKERVRESMCSTKEYKEIFEDDEYVYYFGLEWYVQT